MTTVENISLSTFYETIIENADSNILILDKEFRIVSFNPGFYWVFLEAFDIQLKKGERLFDLMGFTNFSIANRWKIRCQAALKGISVSDEEEFAVHNHEFSWRTYYKALTLEGEQFISIYAQNTSHTRQFQKKILQQELNLRRVLNSFSSSIWLLNERFEVIDFNENAVDYFFNTYSVTLHQSKSFIDLLPEPMLDLRARWHGRLSSSLISRQKTSYVEQMIVNGNTVICEIQVIPVIIDNQVIGFTVVMEDITQRRMNEQLQQNQLNDLTRLSNELDKFISSASQDLRAPLLSIIGVINIMKRESPKDIALFNNIESTVKKLDNFVTNVINYSREEKLEITIGEIDFERLISSVIETLTYLDPSGFVTCIPLIKQNVPFYSDRVRLLAILRNTLTTAFHSLDREMLHTFEIVVRVTTEFASIELRDGDNGVCPTKTERVFEKSFSQTTTSTGSELNLFIVKNTVKKLGGSIEINSSDQKSSVIINLPNCHNTNGAK